MNRLKHYMLSHRWLCKTMAWFCRAFGGNRIKFRGSGNSRRISYAFLLKSKVEVNGTCNKIIIEEGCILKHSHVFIKGSNNTVILSRECVLCGLEIWIEDDNNRCFIGENTWITGNTHLAIIEGTKISVGERCLFSSDITVRTGDSHTILNAEGQRINPSKDIAIGDHVWIGNKVIILKGSIVSTDSVVGAGTLVNKAFKPNVIIAGVPGKVVRDDINWDSAR